MPKLSGLFDSFDNLDQIDINALTSWLNNLPTKPSAVQLENYLANKILYPHTLPLTEIDMKIDLAILREALRMNGPKTPNANTLLGDNPFLNMALRKVIIPEKFMRYVPDLTSLTWAFIDGLLLNRNRKEFFWDLWTVVVADDADLIVGSILLPQFKDKGDSMDLSVQDKNFKIKAGSLTIIPCQKERCEIAYKFLSGKILGKKMSAVEVYGGKLGLMIDGRVQ